MYLPIEGAMIRNRRMNIIHLEQMLASVHPMDHRERRRLEQALANEEASLREYERQARHIAPT